MKKILVAIAAAATIVSGANAQQQELVSNPRGMVTNFDVANIGPILTEMGAVWQEKREPTTGQPYIALSAGGELVLNIIPSACQGQNYTQCIGVNTVALFSGQGLNYQTVSAFNQKYWFTTAGIAPDGSGAYISRYEISDFGIPRGNIAASVMNLVVLAEVFRQELATSSQTVSLEGYAEDLSARLLNARGLTAFAGADAVAPVTRHQTAMEEMSEMVQLLLAAQEAPRNKIDNIAKPK